MTPLAPASRTPTAQRTDVVLLMAETRSRVALRAELIEEGFEVAATDSLAMMRPHLRPGAKPRLVFVDLKDLPRPMQVLEDLRLLMPPRRVIVLTGLGQPSPAEIGRLGFRVLRRPMSVEEIVGDVAAALRALSEGEEDGAPGKN